MSLFSDILRHNFEFLGVTKNFCILDVGCGNGDEVYGLLNLGYRAYGLDVEFKEGPYKSELEDKNIIKLIDIGNETRASLKGGAVYEWPHFEDKIEVIVSRAVIEHVRNLEEFVSATKKTICPENGICLHYYPSKFSVIEPHTGVPFGAILKQKIWFLVMCKLGLSYKNFRNKGYDAYQYMENYTTFRTQKQIDNEFIKQGFARVACLQVLTCHPNKVAKALGVVPFVNLLFEVFRTKVVAYRLNNNN